MNAARSTNVAITPAIARRAQRMVDRLKRHHQIGVESLASRETVADFADRRRLNVHFVGKCRAFAQHYSPTDLARLCRRRRRDGLALNFAHVNILTIVPDKRERARIERLIAERNWTAPTAHRYVKQQYPSGRTHGGRRLKLPEDPLDHWDLAVADAAFFTRRHRGLAARSGKRPSKKRRQAILAVLAELQATTQQLRRKLATG